MEIQNNKPDLPVSGGLNFINSGSPPSLRNEQMLFGGLMLDKGAPKIFKTTDKPN